MKIELNTGLVRIFSGTYETAWQPTEYDETGSYEVPLEYKHSDLMKSIACAYQGEQSQILRDLKEHCPFVSMIHFPGTSYSPREYNFETDVLDFTITVNKTKLLQAVKDLRGNAEFSEFLERYRSRDGFISFTPCYYEGIRDAIRNNTTAFHQAVSAVINFLAGSEFRDIEERVYEYWSGNGYCGLEYAVEQEETA